MTKFYVLFRLLPVATLALVLASCRAKEETPAAPTPEVVSPVSLSPDTISPETIASDNTVPDTPAVPDTSKADAAKTAKAKAEAEAAAAKAEAAAQEAAATAAFEAACSDHITAKMPDPSAASITYTPLLGEDGFSAQVNLAQASGSVITFNYACRRTPGGDVVTNRVAD